MSDIQTESKDGVFTLRFNRPGKKNAVTQAMYRDIFAAFDVAAADPKVRAVLFAGHPDCFSAGNDMQDFMNVPPGPSEQNPTLRFMTQLAEFPKPVVAAPSGMAIGVAVTLLLHCDLVYAGADTRFSLPFVNIGIVPEYVSTYLMPRFMGHARACELLLLGEPFTAQKAQEYALVNALAPNAEVEALAFSKAKVIAQLPPDTVRHTKALLKRWRADVTKEAIPFELNEVARRLKHPEAHEAIGAFLQKRKPDFSRFS